MSLNNLISVVTLVVSLSLVTEVLANSAAQENTKLTKVTSDERTIEHSYTAINIQSQKLGEGRELLVHLPDDYEKSSKRYPVLYLLDGKRHLPHAVAAENILQNEALMPSSIIVAITNNPGTRNRDLSSGKDNFLGFISEEVFPFIAKEFRTSGHKTLFGHSMAGAFTMGVLASNPRSFDNYIAASPVIQMNNSKLISQFKALQLSNKLGEKSLFISFGNASAEGKAAAEAYNIFIKLMHDKPVKNLRWQQQLMSEQVHMTTPYLTFYTGLSFGFLDYQSPRYSGYLDFKNRGEMAGLKAYYQDRSKKYSESPEIPERTLRSLGLVIFDDGHQSKGLEILKLNMEQNPESFRAINALAQVYEDAKQPKQALATYHQGVELAIKNSSRNLAHFKRQVERLKQTNQ